MSEEQPTDEAEETESRDEDEASSPSEDECDSTSSQDEGDAPTDAGLSPSASEDGERDPEDEEELPSGEQREDEDDAEDDESSDPLASITSGDSILAAATLSSQANAEPTEDVPLEAGPGDDEPASPPIWDPVEDLGIPDIAVVAGVQEGPSENPWAPLDDLQAEDILLSELAEEPLGDPWAPVTSGPAPADNTSGKAVRPSVAVPPPVRWLRDGTEPAPTRARALPWQGSASISDPELPNLLYVADVTAERSELLVAAWEWTEDEPGGRQLAFRLTDDGSEFRVLASRPHEPTIECKISIGEERLSARLMLTIERDARGLRLGRDLLAGRFTVDPGTSTWPAD